MATFNFGAAASFQAFGAFAPQPAPQQPYGHQGCSCGTPTQPGYPTSYPQAPQQPQVSAQFQMQMMMSYYMNMMSSMSQLQQGFGSFMGQQQPSPYQLPTGGGYGGGYGNGSSGGYAQAYPPVAQYPAPAPHIAQPPAPKPPAKKGGYA